MPQRLPHIVEIPIDGFARWRPGRKHCQALHRAGRCRGAFAAGVGAGFGFGGAVIIARHHHQRAGVTLVQGLRHGLQVASVKRHRHGVRRG